MVKIGTELSNGATVLQVKTNDLGDTYVLCLFGAEFVTWWINPDRLDSTSSGHYYNDNLKSALEDLKERAKDSRYEEIA
tara:strand:+ start:977 stop:1213 length:237 start_codon:yes stop_codon:yes gene_type:complete